MKEIEDLGLKIWVYSYFLPLLFKPHFPGSLPFLILYFCYWEQRSVIILLLPALGHIPILFLATGIQFTIIPGNLSFLVNST